MKNNTSKPIAEQLKDLKQQQLKDGIKLLKDVIKPQEKRLLKQLKKFVTKSLCDKLYTNHLNNENIVIVSSYIDYEVLEDCIYGNGKISETNDVYVRVNVKINNIDIGIGVWVYVEEKMKLNAGIFQLDTPINDCERTIKNNLVYEFLNIIDESLKPELKTA